MRTGGARCRLYLLSDILHNSTVPVRNASRYRQILQGELAAVFASLATCLRSMDVVIAREAFKRCVLRVLRVWKDWYLFADEVLAGLQSMLVMHGQPEWRHLCPGQVAVRAPSRARPVFACLLPACPSFNCVFISLPL